ncbi:MAG: RNA pseudouridine synthase [Bacteroidia bacterium]|nr:RNA pseudouridine synthase [Bacteroidia bacterium]
MQQDKTHDISLEEKIKEYLKSKYDKPGEAFLGVIHRLDRPVSGVVLFAKTSKALSRMNQKFQEKGIKKTYWAIVKNQPPKDNDTLTHFIFRNSKLNKSFANDIEVADSKKAILSYKLISKSNTYYLLEIDLQTGRHHQIRCQLAKIGCPVKGDLKYGFPRSNKGGGISLHSRKLQFTHPVNKEILEITADPPEDTLWNALIKNSVDKK